MNKEVVMIVGAGVGAGLIYLYDPQMGRRRRALARDKLIHATHRIDDAADMTSRDLTNRAVGIWAELRSSFARKEVGDAVLAERVRSEIGGLVCPDQPLPSAIAVRPWSRE